MDGEDQRGETKGRKKPSTESEGREEERSCNRRWLIGKLGAGEVETEKKEKPEE